ncbi:MAG TPA: rod shape-determining protein MreC [Acidimicrobiales bacterium]|nr:rod shape-determining protein MreC [Acidimicrobiales bacterium]
MAVYRRSNRTRYVLAVLVLAALTLVTVDARSNGSGVLSDIRTKVSDGFSPLQHATHSALQPIGNFLTGALDYGSLRSENQRLRNQVAALQQQSVQSQAQAAAAQQVLAQEHLPFLGGIPTVTAEIIDNGSSNFETSVTIDKGTSSGVAAGQPVVAADGLVGTVLSAGSHTAVVVLMSDPTFAVGVKLPGANIGTAEGVGMADPMRVTVDSTSLAAPKVNVGQVLVTSGLDFEKFPPDIPVGRVKTASTEPGQPEPDIALAPLVNLQELSYVQVLMWAPRT